jgi:hypothetical protein
LKKAGTRVLVLPPEVSGSTVTFGCLVSPPTPLYKSTRFSISFPPGVELAAVPSGLFFTVALLCLHAHWPLLRPCTVELPFRLAPGELEFWKRILDAEIATLEAYRGTRDFSRVTILEGEKPLPEPVAVPDTSRCATAFSGGKDSLLQTGLLAELTRRPLLVTTTSPLPPLLDHLTPRRRQVLRDVAARRDVELVEVTSDFRATWDNDFASRLGYPVAVNEITDTFLYTGALVLAGAARGATHLFLASEAEVQENGEHEGRVIQHTHFMYSAATQRAISSLLSPYGLHYGSLTWSIPSEQVVRLLWTRYPDLCDLQYSCWRVGADEATCSRCSQCLRLALAVLAAGGSPERMGVDLRRLFVAMKDWRPRPSAEGSLLPRDTVSRSLHESVVRSFEAVPLGLVARALSAGKARRLLTPASLRALAGYGRLRRALARRKAPPAPGYRAGFQNLMDPLLRKEIGAVFAASLPTEREDAYGAVLARSEALTRRIVEPLREARPC